MEKARRLLDAVMTQTEHKEGKKKKERCQKKGRKGSSESVHEKEVAGQVDLTLYGACVFSLWLPPPTSTLFNQHNLIAKD